MKDAETRMERVLRGLREAEPADGLERRVLRAVEARSPGGRQASRGGLWRVFAVAPRWYAGAGAVLVLTVLLGFLAWQRNQQGSGHQGAGLAKLVKPAEMAPAAPPVVAAKRPIPRPQPGNAVQPRTRSVRTGREQGLAVSLVGNHPAPEAPLTAEEQLLVRVARRGRAAEYAALDPAVADARLVAEMAEFQGFFEPPKVQEKENTQ